MKTKILKVDAETHKKIKVDASALGITIIEYVRKLAFMEGEK